MNLIAELRSQDTSRIGCAVDGLLMRAADEIERLTAELERAQRCVDLSARAEHALEAERDRLTAELADTKANWHNAIAVASKAFNERTAERDRLRDEVWAKDAAWADVRKRLYEAEQREIRLRAALELLRRGRERRWLPLRGVRDHLTEKVDAFLAGGADETDAYRHISAGICIKHGPWTHKDPWACPGCHAENGDGC